MTVLLSWELSTESAEENGKTLLLVDCEGSEVEHAVLTLSRRDRTHIAHSLKHLHVESQVYRQEERKRRETYPST